MNKIIYILFLIFSFYNAKAQVTNEDRIYDDNIRTVLFQNMFSKDPFVPIIKLGETGQLSLQFDDLTAEYVDYYYTIEHCTHDWKKSNISVMDYLNGFQENRIESYQQSINTLQEYTHYSFVFPNEQVKPKISGNYILKIFRNGDPEDVVITRRFYVYKQMLTTGAKITRGTVTNQRDKTQKVEVVLAHPNISITNPASEIKIVVEQNYRPDNAQIFNRPTFIKNKELVYNDLDLGTFTGGSEFRRIDMRSFRVMSNDIERFFKDERNRLQIVMFTDQNMGAMAYSADTDMDGKMAIANNDFGSAPHIEADYARVYFSLKDVEPTKDGNYYIIGKFSDYQLEDKYKLDFNQATNKYEKAVWLKQGTYDYEYLYVPNDKTKKPTVCITEGCHFETRNTYNVYVYFKPIGKRYEELIGFTTLTSTGSLR